MTVKLDNGLNPPSKERTLSNGISNNDPADYEEQYERRGNDRDSNPPKISGNEGRKLEKKMRHKYPEKRIQRYKEGR